MMPPRPAIYMPGEPSLGNVANIDRGVIPFTRACVNNGMCLNREHLWELSGYLDKEIARLGGEITEHIPQSMLDEFTQASLAIDDFNIDSPDQIATLLFRHLRVGQGVELEMTPTGDRISTGRKQLERIKKDHAVIPLILQRREYTKLQNTYCDTLPNEAIYVPGIDRWKFYYNIGLTFTSTGRMTVSRVHQIPIRTELGRKIRQAFEPEPGMVFISADYAGLELRILAHCAQERKMIEIFSDPKGDIHQNTVDGLNMPSSMDATQQRLAAKRCIAKGQRVLTNHGLVPIENVSCDDLVWDGVEWVSHDGVVSNGVLPTILHDGVRSTLDHVVWTESGEMMYAAEAKRRGARLATTGIDEYPIRYVDDHKFEDSQKLVRVSGGMGAMRSMRTTQRDFNRQYQKRSHGQLQVSTCSQARRRRTDVGEALSDNRTTVLKLGVQELSELRWSWNPEQVSQPRAFPSICSTIPAARYLQEIRHRAQEQRRPLRAGQFTVGDAWSKRAEQANESLDDLQGEAHCSHRFIPSVGCRLSEFRTQPPTHVPPSGLRGSVEGNSETESSWAVQETEVFDIVNAGPRHRYTVENKLVANTNFGIVYGTTDLGLWLTLQSDGVACTREQCAGFQLGFFATYPDVAPYISKMHYRARRYGFAYNIFGRVSPAPEFRSVHKRIVREGERRIQNYVIQSTATDVFKIGAAEVYDFCLEVQDGLFGKPVRLEPLLPFHDQIILQCESSYAVECAEAIGQIMCDCVKLRVPLRVDHPIQEKYWKK